jgi:outer membrane lipoprotein-sorting protein
VPKARQRDYDWLTLVVDPASLDIRGLQTIDAQGGKSSFSFANLKENVGIADKEFAFKIPRGVDVVSAPARP